MNYKFLPYCQKKQFLFLIRSTIKIEQCVVVYGKLDEIEVLQAHCYFMSKLPYNPSDFPRELSPYYISATKKDRDDMLKVLGASCMEDLFSHIADNVKFSTPPKVCKRLEYNALASHLEFMAEENKILPSFLGDGLQHYKVHELVPFVSNIRGLSTAYTPYQPERGQGTLHSLWIYSQTLSALTGLEAINASFYDRSTAIFESLKTALKIKKTKKTVLLSEGIYPGDMEVVQTHASSTSMNLVFVPMDKKSGSLCRERLSALLEQYRGDIAAFCFPQVNHFGHIEDFDYLTDQCREQDILSVAVVDPILHGASGLKEPAVWGKEGMGTAMFVGEGQHLAIGPHYGGPGLGIFGIRFNSGCQNYLRSTAGRFVGKTKDQKGRECFCMVLSTREQHIRREKATSNICSNQSFLATLVGASLLGRGERGLKETLVNARNNALRGFELITRYKGFSPAFNRSFFNEFTIKVPQKARHLIKLARENGIHLGVDVSKRGTDGGHLLLMSFSDIQTDKDFNILKQFMDKHFEDEGISIDPTPLKESVRRKGSPTLNNLDMETLKSFYLSLGEQNISPDDTLYPLGSCTMKYNPHINDWAASLPGFANLHPQVPEEDAQGTLGILYAIQEYFKAVTGLAGVTTQPVAGAQGELVGLKMFQAYHRDRGEGKTRNMILIPRSAHGTNPATAVMAGFQAEHILTTESSHNGQIDLDHLKKYLSNYQNRIAGIMVTNPNTAGIFEQHFAEMAELIHKAGGLVYMDGANMNAIASWIDLDKLGVDAVHNNLHKTWAIPHGGGGPGDAVVCVSEKLVPYLPGRQIRKNAKGLFESHRTKKSIGSFHRHWGNLAHKVRAYTYFRALGTEGVRAMSGVAVLCARYLVAMLDKKFPMLPGEADDIPRMHEFIITLDEQTFNNIQKIGLSKTQIIPLVGKLFLDFGLHAPTVAFPERYGLMIEPTESYTKSELDHFVKVLHSIFTLLRERPEILKTTPHFTPVRYVGEAEGNKNLVLSEEIKGLKAVPINIIPPASLLSMGPEELVKKIIEVHCE